VPPLLLHIATGCSCCCTLPIVVAAVGNLQQQLQPVAIWSSSGGADAWDCSHATAVAWEHYHAVVQHRIAWQ
jgi:hypothetical protein